MATEHGNNLLARRDEKTGQVETLSEHIEQTAMLCSNYCSKIGCPSAGLLLGYLHDMGKASPKWQKYLLRGGEKLDHASYGAFWVKKNANVAPSLARLLEAILCAHHGGLKDMYETCGTSYIEKRLGNKDETAFTSIAENYYSSIIPESELKQLYNKAHEEIMNEIQSICAIREVSEENKDIKDDKLFSLSLLARFLLSCLVDADRFDAAFSLRPCPRSDDAADWNSLSNELELFLKGMSSENDEISLARSEISKACKEQASRPCGIYRLSSPTGSGKTYAGFRFAVNHVKSKKHGRIFYVAPFKTILEQTADNIRKIFPSADILEHHSDIVDRDEKYDLWAERWNAPIILTTMVQFLNTLFAGGNSCTRRFHNLADSVLLIDEPQSVPLECTWMLNIALRFLSNVCGTTVLLMTATPPPSDELKKHKLSISESPEIAPDKSSVFNGMRKISVEDKSREKPIDADKLCQNILEKYNDDKSVLCIVNTKSAALKLYNLLAESVPEEELFFLSTDLCAAHRSDVMRVISERLKRSNNLPVLCVSTQLIEAGVDLSFKTVFRSLAGLDSIVQAAGRCNRDGRYGSGNLVVFEYSSENLDKMPSYRRAQMTAKFVLSDFQENPDYFDKSIFSKPCLKSYYSRLYKDAGNLLGYPASDYMTDATLFNMLASNSSITVKNNDIWRQAFESAGNMFHVIEPGGVSVVVPYGRGSEIIEDLEDRSGTDISKIIRESQRYSVTVRKYEKDRLEQAGKIRLLSDYGVWIAEIDVYDSAKLGLIRNFQEGNSLFI